MTGIFQQSAALSLAVFVGLPVHALPSVADYQFDYALILPDEPSISDGVMQEEIFGPILPILSYTNEQDIEQVIQKFEKPLSFYIFSKDKPFVKRLLRKYSFGGGVVNDTLIHFGNHRLPFGGVGASGNHRPSAFYAADYCAWPQALTQGEHTQEQNSTITRGIRK